MQNHEHNTEPRIRTYMSPVYHRSPASPQHNTPITLKEFPDDKNQRCLIDDLLGGGIVIPQAMLNRITNEGGGPQSSNPGPGISVLLVGPPGSGKSTFALELCYRLARHPNLGAFEHGLSSLYLSVEASSSDIIQQAKSFGWDQGSDAPRIVERCNCVEDDKPLVHVFGRECMEPPSSKHNPSDYFDSPGKMFLNDCIGSALSEKEPLDGSDRQPEIFRAQHLRPKVVVFDSVNVLPKTWAIDDVVDAVGKAFHTGPLLMVAIANSTQISPAAEPWLYFADLVIEMTYAKEEDYLVRKLQIVKARYQDHSDGEHRLKINPRPSAHETVKHPMSPFIKEGGIFVFPSVHRYLSAARRQIAERARLTKPVPTPFAALNNIIQDGGCPTSSCTAIVGSRGGMKSHLAYYTLLKFLRDNPQERALIISLRDEEDAAKDTLAQIIAQQKDEFGKPLHENVETLEKAAKIVEDYLNKDRLEILFFWPGYISTEEFLHLVGVSVDRAPAGQKPVSLVVVNGLEQLSARFPLCAREKMFVSGLITFLCVRGTTNIVVSGGDAGAPPDNGGVPAGLLQMADLIIESSFRLLPKNRIWSDTVWSGPGEEWKRVLREKQYQPQSGSPDEEPHVVYQIIREPGARECRKRALFYMGRREDEKGPEKKETIFFEGSVYVTGLPDDFPYGLKL